MTGSALQAWEGYVLSVDGTGFDARLLDVTAGETVETEEARIPLASLPEAERAFVMRGAFFRWTIHGTDDGAGRSEIAFSRETWTAEDLERARRRGEELSRGIAWE